MSREVGKRIIRTDLATDGFFTDRRGVSVPTPAFPLEAFASAAPSEPCMRRRRPTHLEHRCKKAHWLVAAEFGRGADRHLSEHQRSLLFLVGGSKSEHGRSSAIVGRYRRHSARGTPDGPADDERARW